MSERDIRIEVDGPVLRVTFDRPAQRNAMTFDMYAGLVEACERADADDAVRVVVLRGAGGAAFVAGTDIRQFAGFDGPRGVAYEAEIDATIGRLLDVRVPVVAAIDGFCIGGGLAIASAADIRVASSDARFGYPIARTLGNTLSARSFALAVRHFGHARTIDMIATARLFDAAEADRAGFVSRVTDDVTGTTQGVVDRILAHAPLTIAAAKETLRRLHAAVGDVTDADVLERVYGSEDFAAGVAAFTGSASGGTRSAPDWKGR
jgi:enoyl-CoA hydratase/carnithine racemase